MPTDHKVMKRTRGSDDLFEEEDQETAQMGGSMHVEIADEADAYRA